MDYKPSYYNFFIQDKDDSVIGYNTRSGGLLTISKETHQSFQELIQNNFKTRYPKEEQLFKEFLEGGFIVEKEFDEIEHLQMVNRTNRYATDNLSLTILPTFGCDLDCYYCYENKNPSKMSKEVQSKVVEFIEKTLKNNSALHITWFGGEPLLAKDVILDLSEKFIEICKNTNSNYSADIVTNGTHLDKKTALELSTVLVGSAQITVDGPKKIHDERRYMKGSKDGSFDKIIRNISESCDVINISLRVNVDDSNADHIYDLIDYLVEQKLQKKINIGFSPVHGEGSLYNPNSQNEKLRIQEFNNQHKKEILTTKSFAMLEVKLHEYLVKNGFNFSNAPSQKCNACTADASNSYVIETNGNLQKCWQTVGLVNEKIGDVFTGVKFGNNLSKWINYDPFSNDMCRNCKVLPVCMGWCPIKFLNKEMAALASVDTDPCKTIKYNISGILKLYRDALSSNRLSHFADFE